MVDKKENILSSTDILVKFTICKVEVETMTWGKGRMRRKNKSSFAVISKEFADATSMHGLRFIAQANASIQERILWLVLFFGGLCFAIFFSWKLWNNWENSPVLITIQSANYPINSFPFPTVTVCSVNKVSTRALEEWMTTSEAKNIKVNEMRRILEIISTNRVDDEEEVATLAHLLDEANITSARYDQLMRSLSPNCDDMIIYCLWEDTEENCSKLFETEATDDGYCCSFNSIVLHRDDRSKQIEPETLRYSKASGVYAGLSIILDAELDDYNVTSSDVTGFKVSIQEPNDFARTGKIGFVVSPGFQIDAGVSGQSQNTDARVRSINLKQRLCTTDNEIKLKYFDTYTSPYCNLECLSEIFLANCLCVPYYYPVPSYLPVCSISAYTCIEKAIANQFYSNTSNCVCPDECNYLWYRNEISSGLYPNPVTGYPESVKERFTKLRLFNTTQFKNYAKKNFGKLNVYFKSVSGLGYIMDQRTTWADFISATGGLLGLGFGFSILSAAEVLYFVFVRWIYYRYQKKKRQTIARVFPLHTLALLATNNKSSNYQLKSPFLVPTSRSYPLLQGGSYGAWTFETDANEIFYRKKNSKRQEIIS